MAFAQGRVPYDVGYLHCFCGSPNSELVLQLQFPPKPSYSQFSGEAEGGLELGKKGLGGLSLRAVSASS